MSSSKTVDSSLYFDSFVTLFEELDGASLDEDLSDHLVKRVRKNHGWFLDSVSRFRKPSAESKLALDSKEIVIGDCKFEVRKEIKEASFRVSQCLCLDEVQSYILVSRVCELDESAVDIQSQEFLNLVALQYYHERQCLLKCIRHVFVHAVHMGKGSSSGGDATTVSEAMQLVHDGLEMKLLSTLTKLLSSPTAENSKVDFTILWIEESVIEENLVLDILFLLYYDNFCCCNFEQWSRLCSNFKDILSGSFNTTIFAVSLQIKASFDHAKFQLLLILIETLDLENLLQMIHDEVSFSNQDCSFSLSNIQEMDALVSNFSGLGTKESGPLFLAWAIFTCLLSSLPEMDGNNSVTEIDHIAYLRQAFEAGSFDYLLEILRSDALRDSDGPVSGYLSITRTVISAFIASYELNHQTPANALNLILDILSEIYREEDSLSMQFWDKDSCVDEPIRSLLNMLANEFPFHMLELVRLLSALCSGTWSAECVFNFLEKMGGVTLLSEIPRRSQFTDIYDTIEAQTQLNIPSIEGIVIPAGTRGHIVRVVDVNSALVRWEYEHSGLFLLLLHLNQMSNSCKFEEFCAVLDLLNRMVSSSKALCFSLLFFEKSVPMEASQNYQRIEMTVRVDLIMAICNVALNLVQDVNDSHTASICINVLAEMLKCAPCYVTEVVSRSKIFGTVNSGYSSSWLLSGGLARMLLADHGENGDFSHLTISVLDFTLQLVEKGGDDSLSSTLVLFCLQYILVNHMQWKYRTMHARWKVTLKVLEVMKGCIKATRSSRKLGLLIQDILYSDSSIHGFLCHILCTSPTELERSNASHQYDVKETECLQLAVYSGLYIVHMLLRVFLKQTTSTAPTFVQMVLASTTKPVPIATAAMIWLNFFHNSEIQLAAAKVLSNLIIVGSMVQPYKPDNLSLVVSSTQIRNLKTTFFGILEDTMSTNENLLTALFDLLISAAHHQPTFLNSLILTEDVNESVPAAKGKSSFDLIFEYVKRSETLFRSCPKVLLSFLNFLKAVWDEAIQYLLALEKFRCSEIFWRHMASLLAIEVKADLSSKNLSVNEVHGTSYRYMCQGTVLEILASEVFLLSKLTHSEKSEKSNCTTNSNDQNKHKSVETSMIHSIDVLSTCFGNSTMGNLLKVYPSNDYDEEVIVLAKKSVCTFIVHLVDKLSTDDTGSLSLSVVRNVTSLSQKLYKHPAFAALLAQYSSQGYSNESSQLNRLVLNDLYYHLQGELEGRHIIQGPFQELAQFLLEFEFFQCGVCDNENDNWTSSDVTNMFDVKQVSTEIGLELWEYSGWKTSVEVAKKMLQHMQNANMITSLSVCKINALKALVSIIYEYNGNVVKTKSRMFDSDKIEPSTIYVCKCLQATGDALSTNLRPPRVLQEKLVLQAELLYNLSITIFRQNLEMSNRKKFFPLMLLCIKTSASCIKLLSDVRPSSTMLNKAVKILLTLLLKSIKFIYSKVYAEGKSVLENDHFSEASFTSSALLPILCKYVDHAELSVLSVALMDLMLKCFLKPNTWLPILESHLHLQNIAQIIQQKDDILSVCVYLNFLLTLSRTKSGTRMLYAGNIFSGLKYLMNNSLTRDNFSGNNNEKPEQIWGCCLAIITSMIHSLGDDPSFIDVVDNTICYLFSEKDYILSYILSFPTFSSDEYKKKRARDQKTGTSLTSLRLTEQTLILVCVLVKHQSSWTKGMKEIESQLTERCIHLLAFISKGMQHSGDSPNKYVPTFCTPILKEEIDLNEEPSFIGSKQGWFRICSAGLSTKAKLLSSLALVVKDQASENADVGSKSSFSDIVAIHMYRIALILLKVLCMLAKSAAKRAEELEFIDLAYFPELPMPEILHGIQDQAIAIVTELCEAHKHKSMQQETVNACFLLLQILEKALCLELCVSQSCGLRPVLGRIEDFSKTIKLMMQAMEQHSEFKTLRRSLSQIIALVYPGLLQSGK